MLEISQGKKANIREKTERKGETKQNKKKRGKNWEHEMIYIKRQKHRDEKKRNRNKQNKKKMVPYTLDQSFPGSSVVKNCLPMQETRVQSLGQADPLKEMATHSSILAWEIPWTEKPGGLQTMGSQRVRHDLATKQQHISSHILRRNQ